jgi:hypothetical protein
MFKRKHIERMEGYGCYLNRWYSFPRPTQSAKLPHDNPKAEDILTTTISNQVFYSQGS